MKAFVGITDPEWYRFLLAGAGARGGRPAWVLAGHSQQVGNGLTSATSAYNDAVGSFETRALVSARKFTELGAGQGKEIPEIEVVEVGVRGVGGEQ